MRVLFDPTFDSSPWPGPVGGRQAVFGEAWVGPAYLLDLLETALGLRGRTVPRGVRAGALVPAVRATSGFWSASALVDPLGTARRLLEWRDDLWMAGWRGEGVAPRLAALAAVTAQVLPGPPDRLAAVAAVLERRAADVELVELLSPGEDLPALWRTVLTQLAKRGTRVTKRALEPAQASGDLAAARARDFRPAGDGSLQLVRPHGPLAAAEEIAAWLAQRDTLESTVVIGADPVLDQALRRHGLPTTGGGARTSDNALLQVLPLALAMGWTPPDPHRALELLTLPVSPVPRAIATRLAEALHDWPAVDSDRWRTELREGLAEIEDGEDRERLRRRLGLLFEATVARSSSYPVTEVVRRLDVLGEWIHGRLVEADEPAVWRPAATQCAAMRELVECSALEALTAAELERFVDEATGQDVPLAAYPAQAGLAGVRAPAAVAGPARRVVWWSFDLESVPPIPSLPLSAAERGALTGAGVEWIDPGRAAVAAAQRWRRPLLQATGTLVLVCPRCGEDGTERHPHPLWDEIEANLASGARLSPLMQAVPAPAPATEERVLRALPAPRRDWRVARGMIRPRRRESPSSLGDLLGCSFKWAVSRQGGVRGGRTAALAEAERLLGDLIHELLARLLADGVDAPREAERRAERLFDSEGPRLAAPLFLPGADADRARARRAAGRAAANLVQRLRDGGLAVREVETVRERSTPGVRLRGRPDLVVGPPPAVVDLKWSGASHRCRQLAAGTACQLAAYSYLVGDPGRGVFPPFAFFILNEQRLLATDAQVFAGAEIVAGPDAAATWSAVERGRASQRAALAAGLLQAPGNPDERGEIHPEESGVVDGALVLTPPCRYCELAVLCGKAFEES